MISHDTFQVPLIARNRWSKMDKARSWEIRVQEAGGLWPSVPPPPSSAVESNKGLHLRNTVLWTTPPYPSDFQFQCAIKRYWQKWQKFIYKSLAGYLCLARVSQGPLVLQINSKKIPCSLEINYHVLLLPKTPGRPSLVSAALNYRIHGQLTWVRSPRLSWVRKPSAVVEFFT